MILISTLTLNISDGSTIASTEIYGTDKKTYINIGSGNVFKLYWSTPTLINDIVDHYNLVIKRHDTVLNVYYDIFDKNIGLVNEFYVDSSSLPTVPQYKLSVCVVAYGKHGSVVTSNIVTPYISKGTGAYIKVTPTGYNQPIMKRTIAFTNIGTAAEILEPTLLDITGRELISQDSKTLKATQATRVLSSNTWNVMLDGYTKVADGTWKTNDIKYEVLVDTNGDTITDSNNEHIYIL